MSNKFKPQTDAEVVDDIRDILNALISKMNEGLSRDIIVTIGVDNGDQSGKAALVAYSANKRLQNFKQQQPAVPQG